MRQRKSTVKMTVLRERRDGQKNIGGELRQRKSAEEIIEGHYLR